MQLVNGDPLEPETLEAAFTRPLKTFGRVVDPLSGADVLRSALRGDDQSAGIGYEGLAINSSDTLGP